jgi:WD repeat-containing protein 48
LLLELKCLLLQLQAEPASASPPKTFIEQLRSQSVAPPSTNEVPPLSIPSHVTIVISEESQSGWTPIYRGTVGSVGSDILELERAMPEWLLEFLLRNKAPTITTPKIGFVLLPVPAAPGEEQLPELLNTCVCCAHLPLRCKADDENLINQIPVEAISQPVP